MNLERWWKDSKRRGCESKTRYASRAEAEDSAAFRERTEGLKLGVYECDFCKGWHLTSRSR